jgi:hypothetical protein
VRLLHRAVYLDLVHTMSPLHILTAENIKQLVTDLPLKTLLSHTAKLFHRISRKPDDIQCPPRSKIEGDYFTTLTMPAHISELGLSVKVVAIPRSGVKPNRIGGQSKPGAAKSIGNANKAVRYLNLLTRLYIQVPNRRPLINAHQGQGQGLGSRQRQSCSRNRLGSRKL